MGFLKGAFRIAKLVGKVPGVGAVARAIGGKIGVVDVKEGGSDVGIAVKVSALYRSYNEKKDTNNDGVDDWTAREAVTFLKEVLEVLESEMPR